MRRWAVPLPASRAGPGRGFIVQEAALAGPAELRVPPEICAFLADGTARAGRCGGRRTPATPRLLEGLGRGEAEATRVVGERKDPAFSMRVVLVDDRDARAKARSFGIRSLDTFLTANR